jgi:hypothetical protein
MYFQRVVHLTSLFLAALAQINPLQPGLPILELRYPGTPWVLPGSTLAMSGKMAQAAIRMQY